MTVTVTPENHPLVDALLAYARTTRAEQAAAPFLNEGPDLGSSAAWESVRYLGGADLGQEWWNCWEDLAPEHDRAAFEWLVNAADADDEWLDLSAAIDEHGWEDTCPRCGRC